MTKGKPWTKKEKQTPIQRAKKGKSVDVTAKALGKSENAIFIKLRRLRLEVESNKISLSTTSCSDLSKELPTVKNVMKRLSAALVALESPDIDKKEVIRLSRLIQDFKIYTDRFADFEEAEEEQGARGNMSHT